MLGNKGEFIHKVEDKEIEVKSSGDGFDFVGLGQRGVKDDLVSR